MKKILLIDDDDDESYFFEEALQEMNGDYEYKHAQNVKEGMHLLVNAKPELVFMDINMPGIDGFEGMRLLKEKKLVIDIPVILYSTTFSDETMKKGLALGAVACIQKKISVLGLVEVLKDIFNRF